jgi:hypothetical protein
MEISTAGIILPCLLFYGQIGLFPALERQKFKNSPDINVRGV